MQKNKSDENSREFQRRLREVTVEINELQYPLPTKATEVTQIKDISPKGICFRSSIFFKPKTILTATIHLSGWQRHKKSLSFMLDDSSLGKPLTVIGEVVWSKKDTQSEHFEIGVKFIDIPEDDYQALKKFLVPPTNSTGQ